MRYYKGSGRTREEIDGPLSDNPLNPARGIIIAVVFMTAMWSIGFLIFG